MLRDFWQESSPAVPFERRSGHRWGTGVQQHGAAGTTGRPSRIQRKNVTEVSRYLGVVDTFV